MEKQPIFYSLESKVVKKFIVVDIIIGTGLYYMCRASFSSEAAGIIGSIIGTEGIRRLPNTR